MFSLPENPTRKDVLEFISRSASYGNLGAFIGAGFTKAVLNGKKGKIALSWGELLERASEEMEVDYAAVAKIGIGYPEIASAICLAHSEVKGVDYGKSLSKLKHCIAALTAWYPNKEKRADFSEYLESLAPEWIITTNYDLVIETLLTGKSIPLGPNDSLSSPVGVVPVFHLHGLRTNPDEIIIAQEDYVSLFRPSEYRQIKLALTIKESTTILIGYGLGDVNVLTALDWSRNVFKGEEPSYPNGVIQVLRTEDPANAPYTDRNGIVIIETADISDFFEEFSVVRKALLVEEQMVRDEIVVLSDQLDDPASTMIEQFVESAKFRKDLLAALGDFPIHLISGFVSFLDKCIEETWVRSSVAGAFEGYNENLIMLIDILVAFPVQGFPPALFQTAAYSLERVGSLVGDGWGQSWSAHKTWEARKNELSAEIVFELRNFGLQHAYFHVDRLLKNL